MLAGLVSVAGRVLRGLPLPNSLDDGVEGGEVDEVDLFVVGLYQCLYVGNLLILWDALTLPVKQGHHRLVLEAQLGIVNGASKMVAGIL